MVDDCDLDCQKTGSQLTLISVLLSVCYGLIGLNALFMFIGTWNFPFRVCSVYCTLFMCLFQLCIQISVGALLFSKYNKVCIRSVYQTYTNMYWTISDDMAMITALWITGFFSMFCFVCCGMCSAMKPSEK